MKYPRFWKLLVLFATPAFLTPAMAAPAKAQSTGSYTVKSGDTFAKIARARGVSLGTLLKSNHLSNSDHITPGQRIVVPGSKAPAAKTAAAFTSKKPAAKTATVKSSAAKTKGAAVSKKTTPVVTGTKRKSVDTTVNVTPPPKKGTCIVQSGDTLARIQRRTGAPMPEILRLNKLTATSALRAGQTLKLPQEKAAVVVKNTKPQPEAVIVTRNPAPITDRRPSERPDPAPQSDVTLETGTAQHKVAAGDTFSSIRRAYGVTETQLAKANPSVNAKNLKIGQSLTIPSQPLRIQAKPQMVRADGRILAQRHDPLMTAGGTDEGLSADRTRTGYLVEEGDNIEKVAHRFSTTEREIRRLNRMGDADEISPGRYILVPFIRQAPEASAFARRDA